MYMHREVDNFLQLLQGVAIWIGMVIKDDNPQLE